MQKRAEASIAVASSVPDKSVVEPPRMLGDMPVSPKTTLILITAVIFGLLFPFGIILMQDYFNNTISHKDEISQITDFPIIGTVVEGPSSTELVTQDYPGSAAAESFKFVKFNLSRDMLKQKRITVGVTSSLEGEGKTYCAANLSIEFARSGKRTLLIDFDLRRSRLHKIFRSKAKGITDYILSDHMLLSDIVQPTLINNLHIISAGSTTAQDYSNLLDHPKSLDIIPKLVNDYEAIIVDTPPLTYVADYLIIQPLLDTTLLVIRHNYTDHRIVRSALDLLKSNNVNDVKVIFNGVKEDVSTYGYRYVNGKSKYLNAKRRVRYRQKA
jgi:capsular exopolysaccharide synthesis family protein